MRCAPRVWPQPPKVLEFQRIVIFFQQLPMVSMPWTFHLLGTHGPLDPHPTVFQFAFALSSGMEDHCSCSLLITILYSDHCGLVQLFSWRISRPGSRSSSPSSSPSGSLLPASSTWWASQVFSSCFFLLICSNALFGCSSSSVALYFFFSSVQFVVGLSLVNRWRTSETPRGSLFHKLACIKKMKMWCSTISVSISVYFFQHIYSVTCFYRHSTYKKILNFYHPSIPLFWSI